MSSHQASEQMIGYLYQIHYALKLLLENDNPDYQISFEKFDDVAFDKDGQPIQLIQLKHHVKHQGNLTNSSTDLWRTLKVWIDFLSQKKELLNNTEFLIITTAIAPENSAAWYLKKDNRNIDKAYQILNKICINSKSTTNENFYSAFLNADKSIQKRLLEHIYIIDGASNIVDVEKTLRKQIRYSCIPKYEDCIYERLLGWWYKKAIETLCSDNPIFVTQNQIRSFIVNISKEYSDENLPIDIFIDDKDLLENGLSEARKIFYAQLKLICLGDRSMKLALRDYYYAFKQRASWVRNDLLYVNELEKYEECLIDEWEHSFAEMEDNLNDIKLITEKDKIKAGRNLLSNIRRKDIRIRPKCQDPFIMRGSYHLLSNKLKVGWHINFFERLENLLHIK
ncbi:hypothetical protein B5F82_04020 [Megamonas hypermegale]|uniref:ABC-three component system protein n=1 Tax=Megamonas hypermegale TaxID=158847 RepID=UPI000B368EE7|nr:ABC-three component system protein [Megamonas hypermegale]OUO40596.1 hypothetical protein B5F82_04020 [Megamonas hypermegale]